MINTEIDLEKYLNKIESIDSLVVKGLVTDISGLVIGATGPMVPVGNVCLIYTSDKRVIRAEVVGFGDKKVLLMPLGEMEGISAGDLV